MIPKSESKPLLGDSLAEPEDWKSFLCLIPKPECFGHFG